MKPEIFLEKIKKEFPLLKWKKYKFLLHGWDHVIVVLDSKIIFRTPKRIEKGLKFELYNETQLLKYLKKKVEVGTPEYAYISRDKSFAGYEMLVGEEFTKTRFKILSDSQKEEFAMQIAGFITVLHTTPKSIIKKYQVRIDNPRKDYVELARSIKKMVFPRLRKNDIVIAEKYFNNLKTAINRNFSQSLTHSDLTWEHILWDKNKKQINIIDFSDRVFGDPAIDFAGLWEYGEGLVNRVYELYQGKKDKNLLERSRLYYQRIAFYVMKDALDGFPCKFSDGYKMFKSRFK